MKDEKLFDTMAEINDDYIAEAHSIQKKKKHYSWSRWVVAAACAVLIVGAVVSIPALRKGTDVNYPPSVAAVVAEYPKPVNEKLSADEFMEGNEHGKWWSSYREQIIKSNELQPELDFYYSDIMKHMLVSENENTVISPLNTYFAFALLAEVSDGNTRQQILNMLKVKDIETLRNNVSDLWKSNYADTPVLKSVLANSLWLNSNVKYNNGTLNLLADKYYASAFSGIPGSAEMDQALRMWTDNNTGNLLKEYTKEMSLDSDTVLEILSTIYYKAMWTHAFQVNKTVKETFHGVSGDTTVDMMKKADMLGVYRTDSFTSVGMHLNDSGMMYFILPEENTDVNSLVSNPDILKSFRTDTDPENYSSALVHLSVPKFRVSSKTNMLETIRQLGVTDALNAELADFTPLTTEREGLSLSKADHAAMLEIDEHGVIGAAYTELALTEGAMIEYDEIDFVLDRPFMFIVTGGDGSVLFSGVVRNIEEMD